MRAAIYARFSSDLQNERSIDDQVVLCRSHAQRLGLAVVSTFSDRARSGASILGRDGLMQMMDAARDGAFDVLVVEALDRLSRDQEDLAGLWKRLGFLGIEIRAVHEGKADAVQIGVRGLVGALYLQDLAHKVRRGLSGVVRNGRHAGGRAYGYRPVAGRPGEMMIVEEEADIVRRIFAEYVDGRPPRDIACALNREGVPPPRGRLWNGSAINGSRQRGSGILQNELYVGRIVWNKVRMVKDPDTGRRVSRPNPVEEWQSADAPHLAIVEPSLFAAARQRKETLGGAKPQHRRRPRHLLSGLLRCGRCGAGMSVHDRGRTGKTRIRCSAVRESGACDHRRVYYLESVERVVVDGLRTELRDPQLIAEYVRTYQEERRRLAGEETARRGRIEQKLGETTRAIGRLVDALAAGLASAASVRERLQELEAEKVRLGEEHAALAPPVDVVALHPAAVSRYLGQVENLSRALTEAGAIRRGSSADAFRSLAESVIVHPTEPRTPLDVELRGYLAELTKSPTFPPNGRHSGFVLVAGEGLEPPTPGL
ncbi:recombinase family protein [Ancylobacter mangrovi]|uniref:recombinase family protein n=1 Tax=Ancylobacter mangrovi TaxID=2972472 RepID=UPI0021628BBB|nr:recombinase family protein [Ancylobacter mangrovi]MCS0501424.1 recombinase family protein [Ancylobacter mangrovi]